MKETQRRTKSHEMTAHRKAISTYIKQCKRKADKFEFEYLKQDDEACYGQKSYRCLTCGPESTDHPTRLHNGYRLFWAQHEITYPSKEDYVTNQWVYLDKVGEMLKLFDERLAQRMARRLGARAPEPEEKLTA